MAAAQPMGGILVGGAFFALFTFAFNIISKNIAGQVVNIAAVAGGALLEGMVFGVLMRFFPLSRNNDRGDES